MSNIVTGQAPIVNYLLNLTSTSLNFDDNDAVNHLLNNTSSKVYSSYTQISSNTTSLMNGLMLSTPANKSLLVFNNANVSGLVENITTANITYTSGGITDQYTFNATLSVVLRADQYRFKITTPGTDVGTLTAPYVQSESSTLRLTEVAPTSQGDVTALNDLRILNATGELTPGYSLNYLNTTDALGVEGKAYYYNSTNGFIPNYKNYTSYETLASNNISLSIDNLTTSNAYTYEVVKISSNDAYFNMTSSTYGNGANATGNVAYVLGGGVSLSTLGSNYTLGYAIFPGAYNYTGLIGATAMNQVYTQNLIINMSNAVNVTQAISGGNSFLVVNPTFVAMNNFTTTTQVNNITFANTMSVALTPSQANWTGSTANIPSSTVTIVQASESLPSGNQLDNATLSFSSASRSTTNSTNSYNLSSNIYYQIDGSLNTSLTDSYMTTESVNFTLKVVDGATINNPVANSWANSSGLYVWNTFTDSTYNPTNPMPGALNVTGPVFSDNSNKTSFVAKVSSVEICDFLNNTSSYNGNFLLAVTGGNASNSSYVGTNFTLASVSNSSPYGNITGVSLNGTFNCTDWIAAPRFYSQTDIRIRFTANNPLYATCDPQSTTPIPINITASGSNITTANITSHNVTTQYLVAENVVTYNSNATFGPLSYMDLPSSELYRQRYIIVFPDTNEVKGNSVYPERVDVEAYNGDTGSLLGTTSFPLSFAAGNFENIAGISRAVTSGNYTTMTYMIKFDLSMSGIKNGSVGLKVPVSYRYNSNDRTWDGVKPSLSFDLTFDTCKLYTHNMSLQGKNTTTGVWENTNSGNEPPYNKIDLRRSPYDALLFKSTIFYLVVSLYPSLGQDFNNIDYAIPITSAPAGSGSGGLQAVYGEISSGSTLASGVAAWGTDSVSYSNVRSLVDSNSGSLNAMSVTLLTGTSGGSLIYPASWRMSATTPSGETFEFTYTINDTSGSVRSSPSYMIDLAKSLVSVQDSVSGLTTYVMIGNSASTQLIPGVYATSTNIEKAFTQTDLGSISLNKDSYSASVYNGQFVTNQLIPSNLKLIDGTSYGGGVVTFTLNTNKYRGYKNVADVYVIARSQLSYNATFGAYSQSGVLTPAADGNPTVLTLDYGNGFGFKTNLIVNPTSASTATFTVNKTNVSLNWFGGVYNFTGGYSGSDLKMTSLVYHQNQVPFVELLYMNNFFVPGNNQGIVGFVQSPVVVSTSATYASTNNTTPANSFLDSVLSYTQQQALTDANIISASYKIDQDQVHLTYNSNYMLRPQGKTFYVTVAPMDVTVKHKLGGAIATSWVSLSTASQGFVVNMVPINGNYAKYTLDFEPGFYVSSLKNPSVSAPANFNYQPNLFTMQGAPLGDPLTQVWYEYFTQESLVGGTFNFTNSLYCYTFGQEGVDGEQDEIVLCWSNPYTRPVYDATASYAFDYGWSDKLDVTPSTLSQFKQYELGFRYNSSNVLIPVVTKYTSVYYNNEANVTAASSTNGWSQHINTLSGELLYINTTALTLPNELPYKYNTTNFYPQPSTRTVTITSSVNLSGAYLPSQMDLVINVRNTTGVTAYNRYVNITTGDTQTTKILNVFAKDQLVVQDYLGNLGFRVGPNGHVYGGDISTYSLTVNDNQPNPPQNVNGNHLPIYNADVNLV